MQVTLATNVPWGPLVCSHCVVWMVGYKREISKHNWLFHVLIFVSWVWREISKVKLHFLFVCFFNEHSFENSGNRVLWLKNKSRSQVPFAFFYFTFLSIFCKVTSIARQLADAPLDLTTLQAESGRGKEKLLLGRVTLFNKRSSPLGFSSYICCLATAL